MFTSRPGRPAAPGAPVQRTDRTRQVRCEGPGQVRILNKFLIATDTEDWSTVGAWPPGRRLQRALCTLNPHAPVGPVSPQSGLAGRIRRPASRLLSFKWPEMTARRRRGRPPMPAPSFQPVAATAPPQACPSACQARTGTQSPSRQAASAAERQAVRQCASPACISALD